MPAIFVVAAIAAVAGVCALAGPATEPEKPRRYPRMSRRDNADIIDEQMIAAGYSRAMIDAATANAIAESNLNNAAWVRNEREDSAGLFALNARGGAGAGMSLLDRTDPYKNIARILQEVKRDGKRLREAEARGATAAELAAIWMQDIERPAERKTGGTNWRWRSWLATEVSAGRLPEAGKWPGFKPLAVSGQRRSVG